jgi:uncharacterized membrane protein
MSLDTHVVKEKNLHQAFEITIALKGVGAVIEAVLGAVLILTTRVTDLIYVLIQNELLDDPNDFFATHARALFHPSHEAQIFGGIYLLSHGIVKAFLVVGLLRNKPWAYPASLAVFSLFILYQMTRWLHTHSVWLLLLTIVDLIVMWLIWHEYQRIRTEKHPV